MKNTLYELLDLRKDQEQPHIIDGTIRSGVRVVGTNLWVLVFAILVASVGLNVNSTAVIIGAMLISPLMGPIVGVGYGAGINDFELIKLSIKNLGIFTFISILASTLYFVISPLDTPQSELLSRTSPTLWDVLIAFFGGAAGIIALTRKSISNVVPGVAIATALMPPLCTAGFGIAHADWKFFGGAFFLYTINSVFIAFATLIFVKLFKLPKHKELDDTVEKRTNWIVATTVLITIVPSAYLAYQLVKQNSFHKTVEGVLATTHHDPNYVVLAEEINSKANQVYLTVGGENPPKNLSQKIQEQLKTKGLADTKVIVRYTGGNQLDMSTLKSELQEDLYQNLQNQVNDLIAKNERLVLENKSLKSSTTKNQALFGEIRAQYPSVGSISIAIGQQNEVQADKTTGDNAVTLIALEADDTLKDVDRQRLRNWLGERFKGTEVKMLYLPNKNTPDTQSANQLTTNTNQDKVN